MKRLTFVLLVLLITSVAAAQFPAELRGEKGVFEGTVAIQGELDAAHTPWGNIWREDPEIIYFGEMSTPTLSTLMLNWQFVAHHCGEAFWNAGPALEWLAFTWDEDLGCYANIISKTADRIVLHAFTLEEEQAVWRSGVLIRNGEVWTFDSNNYREATVLSQQIYIFNHAVIEQMLLPQEVK